MDASREGVPVTATNQMTALGCVGATATADGGCVATAASTKALWIMINAVGTTFGVLYVSLLSGFPALDFPAE